MATYAGWTNRLALFWERPLGTVETTGKLWLSKTPDGMSLGNEVTQRRTFGNRYLKDDNLLVQKSTPAGVLGPTPMWFEKNGTQTFLNRILNTHFQNTFELSPIPGLCYVAHFPVDEQPSSLSGFTVLRDIGLGIGTTYKWESCVANDLVVSWVAGKPITIQPGFLALNGDSYGASPGIIATDQCYQGLYYQAPNIETSWNGTRIFLSSFKITSNNGMVVKHDHHNTGPVGFTTGSFSATLEFQTWVDDDFYTRFVPDYSTGTGIPLEKIGTFMAVVEGPVSVGSTLEYDMGTIYFRGKIVSSPDAMTSKDGKQTIKINMTSPGTGTTYEDAGYYIKLDSDSYTWQAIH